MNAFYVLPMLFIETKLILYEPSTRFSLKYVRNLCRAALVPVLKCAFRIYAISYVWASLDTESNINDKNLQYEMPICVHD